MASEIRVNTINNSSGLGTITISDTGAVFAGVTTITSLQVTGAFTGSEVVTSTGMIVTGVTTVAAGSTSAPSISPSGDTNTGIFFPSADTIAFGEGGAEVARIDSSGRLLVGTSSDRNVGGHNAKFQLEDTGYSATLQSVRNVNGVDGAYLFLGKSRGTTLGSNTIVQSGDELGNVRFYGADGSTMRGAAEITCSVDGTPGDSDMPGRLVFSTTADGASSPTERMRIDSSGRMGLGTASPGSYDSRADDLVIQGSGDTGITIATTNTSSITGIHFADGTTPADPYRGSIRYNHSDNALIYAQGDSERWRTDTNGRFLVGTSTSSGFASARMIINSAGTDTTGSANLVLQVGEENSTISANEQIGSITFGDESGYSYATIQANADLAAGSDSPGRLVFSTTADGASSPTERMRITNGGYLKTANNGAYQDSSASWHEFNNTANEATVLLKAANTSFSQFNLRTGCLRSANTAWSVLRAESGDGSTNAFYDVEFNLRGDGNAFADGTWSGGGADYAEYFEWSDSNPNKEDRRGISVVLDGDKIREAVAGEDPIGVISGNPSVVGDAAWNKWNGKHLRDEFGSYLLDAEGNRQLNPDYDPDVEYISREDRPEWDCVGLMGKLRIRKGQITGSRWIKMRDISDTVEEWLVR